MEEATLEPLSVSSFLTIHVVSFNKILFFSNIVKYIIIKQHYILKSLMQLCRIKLVYFKLTSLIFKLVLANYILCQLNVLLIIFSLSKRNLDYLRQR